MRTRRRMLQLVLGAVVIASVALAGCGAPAPASPTATTAAAKPAASPTAGLVKPAGEVKIALTTFHSVTPDPMDSGQGTAQKVTAAVFDSLVSVSVDGKPAPGVAERWEASPDGKSWTFYIRKGIKFHDGTDLTGEDVKFSIDRMISNPKATGTAVPLIRSKVDNVQLRDPYAVVVNLKVIDAEFWKLFQPGSASEGLIVPKKYVEEKGVDYFKQHPMGSGPFKVLKWDPAGTGIDLEAVEGHWRATPQFKSVKLQAVPEDATRIAMLKTGQVDFAQINPDNIAEVKAAGLSVTAVENAWHSGFSLQYDVSDPSKHPLGNVKVRTALSLAINRVEIANTLFKGYARPVPNYYVPTTVYFYDPKLQPDPYDLGQAKKLLAEAGYPNGFDMKLISLPLNPALVAESDAVAGYWRALGVKVEIVPMEFAALMPMVSPVVKSNVFGSAISWTVPGVMGFDMARAYHSKTGFMKSNYNDTQLDADMDKVTATLDPEERKKLALDVAIRAHQAETILGGLMHDSLYGVGKKVGGWTPVQGFEIPALGYETLIRVQ